MAIDIWDAKLFSDRLIKDAESCLFELQSNGTMDKTKLVFSFSKKSP